VNNNNSKAVKTNDIAAKWKIFAGFFSFFKAMKEKRSSLIVNALIIITLFHEILKKYAINEAMNKAVIIS
jgi:hypothetical protein